MTSPQKKLLLLDLDGTLREPASGKNFIQHPLDQQIIPGADTAITHYAAQGYLCVGISNQGGVAAGHKSLDDAILEQRHTLELFPQLRAIFFCPDFEGRYCWFVRRGIEAMAAHDFSDIPWVSELSRKFRKPQPGMLLAAHKNYSPATPISELWFVGDREEDAQAAKNAGCNFVHAKIWRDRFLPGIYEISGITRKQIEFLEGKFEWD